MALLLPVLPSEYLSSLCLDSISSLSALQRPFPVSDTLSPEPSVSSLLPQPEREACVPARPPIGTV